MLAAALCFSVAVIAPAAYELPALEITRISIAESQILIEFNRAVVPLGRMERRAEELPIKIAPQVNCRWRWISTQALACNLDQKDYLKPAHEYVVTVAPGIQAMDGATTSETLIRKRETERPNVYTAWRQAWEHPGVPVFQVRFNQPVTRESVAASLYFRINGFTDPVAVTVEPDPYDDRPPVYVAPTLEQDPGESELASASTGQGSSAQATDGQEAPRPSVQTSEERPVAPPEGREARRLWIVKPAGELPLGRRGRLNARAGLESALGPLRGRERGGLSRVVTFGEFRFAGVACRNNDGDQIRYLPGGSVVSIQHYRQWDGASRERQVAISGEKARCNPLSQVALAFTSPVLASQIARELAFAPGLAGKREDYDPWSQVRDYSSLGWMDGSRLFHVNLPERLQAFQEYRISSRPAKNGDGTVQTAIRDEFGRLLNLQIDLSFATDHRLPNVRMPYRDAVLESGVDSEYPLYVTNLEEVRLNYRMLNQEGGQTGLSHVITPPKVTDVAFAVPLGVRQMTGGKSGAVLGRINSRPPTRYGSARWEYFAQVTPYQVHAKVGHYNTLVWVTSLRTGKPVRGAEITLLEDSYSGLFGRAQESRPSCKRPALPGAEWPCCRARKNLIPR